MRRHVEKENIMVFGRKAIDVSNIAIKKIDAAIERFNEAVAKVQAGELDSKGFNSVIDIIGVDFIKHEYKTLRIRFSPVKSIIEMMKRHFFTIDDVKSLSKENYNEFHDWVYFQITGRKKKDLETQNEVMEMTLKIYQEAKEKLNLNQETCTELLMTYLKDQTKPLSPSTEDLSQS